MKRICLDCGNPTNETDCERCNGETADMETLSGLAHRLWMHWSQHIAMDEDISEKRVSRWRDLWTDYRRLSPQEQNKDRELVEEMLRNKRHPEEKWD